MPKRIINDKLRDEISQADGGAVEKQMLLELLELEISSTDIDIEDYKKVLSKHIS